MSGDSATVALLSFAHPHAIGYARLLAADPGVRLVATDPDGVSEPGVPRGAALAAALGVDYVAGYRDAVAGADAAIVCAENAHHRALVECAAAAGVHVLCEKPLATSVPDAMAMVAACDRAGVGLMTAYPVRFSPAFADLRARVAAGEIGDVLGVQGTNNGKIPRDRAWFTDPALSGGGALVDHVVHCADLLDALLGEPAATVYAVTNRILAGDRVAVETGGLVSITYPSGVVATIDCSWSRPDDAPSWGGLTLRVTGTGGTVDVDPFGHGVTGHAVGHGELWLPYGPDLDAAMLAEFLSAVRDHRAPQPDGRVGVRTLRIVVAAQESVATGQPVRLS